MNIFLELVLRFLSFIPALIYISIPIFGLLSFRKKWARNMFFITVSVPLMLLIAGVFVDLTSGMSLVPASIAYPVSFAYSTPGKVDKYITDKKVVGLYIEMVHDNERIDALLEKYPKLVKYEYATMYEFFHNTMLYSQDIKERVVSQRIQLSPNQIRRLWKKSGKEAMYNDTDYSIRGMIIRYYKTPKDLLRNIYHEEKEKGLVHYSQILRNPNLPNDVIFDILDNKNGQIRAAISNNPAYHQFKIKHEGE